MAILVIGNKDNNMICIIPRDDLKEMQDAISEVKEFMDELQTQYFVEVDKFRELIDELQFDGAMNNVINLDDFLDEIDVTEKAKVKAIAKSVEQVLEYAKSKNSERK